MMALILLHVLKLDSLISNLCLHIFESLIIKSIFILIIWTYWRVDLWFAFNFNFLNRFYFNPVFCFVSIFLLQIHLYIIFTLVPTFPVLQWLTELILTVRKQITIRLLPSCRRSMWILCKLITLCYCWWVLFWLVIYIQINHLATRFFSVLICDVIYLNFYSLVWYIYIERRLWASFLLLKL